MRKTSTGGVKFTTEASLKSEFAPFKFVDDDGETMLLMGHLSGHAHSPFGL